jgi:hypothetical protein
MAVEHGFIVLGDVSGYGEFIATTELEHSREILAELLSTLCECAPGRLNIAQLEGDAVFWLCGDDAPDLVDVLKEKFVEYHRRLRFMTIATTCPCRACASVGALTLKFVVHRGSWVRQRVAGNEHFVGDDLVLAHRLLKNSVPSHEYILLTDVALRAFATEGAVPHEEHVDHHGMVRCAYIDLSDLRARALTERTDHLDRREAQWVDERELPVPIARARDVVRQDVLGGWRGEHFQLLEGPPGANDTSARQTPPTSGAEVAHTVARQGARGSDLGQEIHCHHEGDVELMRVVRSDREPGQSRATFHIFGGRDAFYLTEILSETPTGSRIEVRVAWEPIGDSKSRVSDPIADLLKGDLDRLAASCGS